MKTFFLGLCVFLCVGIIPLSSFGKETKEWTVYIHLNADNNLCSFAAGDLIEMKSLDVSKTANIIVGYDCSQQNDSRLIEIKGNKETDITKKILGINTPTEFDMGDINFFNTTATKVFSNYPSKRKMIVVWNHGSGWDLVGDDIISKGVSYDDQSGHHFTTVQFGQAMKELASLYSIDILGYDACLMQMVEIAYEYADYAKYSLASEDSIPGEGWDYTFVVKALDKGSAITTEEFGKIIIDGYVGYYANDSVTLSLINHEKLKYLVKGLADIVPDLKKQAGMKQMVSNVPGWYGVSKDLGLFLDKLPEAYAAKVKDLYTDTITYSGSTQPSSGLAIYLTNYPSSNYKNLKFNLDTGWYSFLSEMLP